MTPKKTIPLFRYTVLPLCLAFLFLTPYAGTAQEAAPSPLNNAAALYKDRKYRDLQNYLNQILPVLKGNDRSKALLYLGYSNDRLKNKAAAAEIFKKVGEDRSVSGRHRTEAWLAYAKMAERSGESPGSAYWKILEISGGNPNHREAARQYFQTIVSKTAVPARPGATETYVENNNYFGLSTRNAAVLFNRRTGLPAALWSGKRTDNLLNNDATNMPFWELRFNNAAGESRSVDSLETAEVHYEFLKSPAAPGLKIIYTLNTPPVKGEVTVTARCPADSSFPEMTVAFTNRNQGLRLWELDFPKLALCPSGKPEDNQVVFPWRRGRLWPLERFQQPNMQEYPGSSARFQFIALYGKFSGTYFSSLDNSGCEKIFREFYNPAANLFAVTVTQFPSGRGTPGNSITLPYSYKLGGFEGDWYDAARIYRQWWQQQPWAARGPLAFNKEVPEWLKKAPVFLRFYLRAGKNIGIEQNLKSALEWGEFLEHRPTPATLYHYSQFEEPANRPNYPVAEYYGYCAPPFPGLVEMLKTLREANIRPNVYLQSEIFNQDHPANAELEETIRVDVNGKPRLYVEERWIACRRSTLWRQRILEMSSHLLDMGFSGIYLDTYGKSKINHECFQTAHGHPCGGGNVDCAGQRGMGEQVKTLVKGRNHDFYIGGEACVEAFVDILDYKLNATNVYKDMVSLERVLYGDYYLSHGRVMNKSDDNNEGKLLAMDFLEGVIPGRFFCSSRKSLPQSAEGRKRLKETILYTEHALDYLRLGEMLRPLKFASPVPQQTVLDTVSNNPITLPSLANAVYRSWKDKSIGIAVINIADTEQENQIILPPPAEWGVSPEAELCAMNANGEKTPVGTLNTLKSLSVRLAPNGTAFFIVANPQK